MKTLLQLFTHSVIFLMAIINVQGPFLFFLIIFPLTIFSSPDSEALLKLKLSFTNTAALDSWQPGTEPCAGQEYWDGVLCENGVVSGLRLGQMGLSGSIDIDALLLLSGLRSVSVMHNSFSGQIPGFNQIETLRGLYLSGNQFSGEIPSDFFASMDGLRNIWLSENKFSGPIPSSVSKISQLLELNLDRNQFVGRIPELEQQNLISLNLSNNNLEGEIPASLSRFGADAFAGNPMLCGGISGKSCPKKSSIGTIIAILCLAVLIVSVVSTIAVMCMRRGKNQKKPMDLPTVKESIHINPVIESNIILPPTVVEKDIDADKSNRSALAKRGSRDLVIVNDERGEFGLSDLMKAAAEVLGNGTLGSSFKATMVDGLSVVVKRVKEMNILSREKFDREMKRLASLRHKNLLPILAYHYRKEEKLLVSEYQQKGSLMFVLHGDRGVAHLELSWPVRLKIIQGIARGLGYLHTELSSLDLPHGDLKSSNVLLSPDHEPLLADYGFCTFMSSSQAAQVLIAYRSPEGVLQQHISPKCDVYCLGIIILEIVTGKLPSQYGNNPQGGTDLVQWVRSAIAEGREAELVDPDITRGSGSGSGNEMVQLLQIGSMCTESIPDQRLELREAIRRIEGI